MSDDLFDRFLVEPLERNPLRATQREARRPAVKRFYTDVLLTEIDGVFAVSLDGKHVRTPLQRPLRLRTHAAGAAVAAEWMRQRDTINPGDMPMTTIANAGIDGVADHLAECRTEIVKFATSDLVCYRASTPVALEALEAAAWDPVLAWARDCLDADLRICTGIVFTPQPEAALAALSRAVAAVADPVALACLHAMTTLCGSTLLALAVARAFMTAPAAWDAAHVDEDFQTQLWGSDDEATARRAHRWREMDAAAKLFALLD